jgi:hypothetical protein
MIQSNWYFFSPIYFILLPKKVIRRRQIFGARSQSSEQTQVSQVFLLGDLCASIQSRLRLSLPAVKSATNPTIHYSMFMIQRSLIQGYTVKKACDVSNQAPLPRVW